MANSNFFRNLFGGSQSETPRRNGQRRSGGRESNNNPTSSGVRIQFVPISPQALIEQLFDGVPQLFGFGDADAAAAASFEAAASQSRGPPAASPRAIRQLPVIQVKPEDLVEATNRECCICCEAHRLDDRVLRLPCAHIFHTDCILPWLQSHCTCPVCRYELPTDDPEYERGRLARMRHRKPRYARHELDRMSVKELKQLVPTGMLKKAADKDDLIEYLIQSGKIDIISAPEPVSYSLSELQAMSVRQLRDCMNEAGVFFDPRDVIEKDDMLRIFLLSGRLNVLVEEVGEQSTFDSFKEDPRAVMSTTGDPILVETVGEEDSETEGKLDRREDVTLLMEVNENFHGKVKQSDRTTDNDGASSNEFSPLSHQQDDRGDSAQAKHQANVKIDDIGHARNDMQTMDEIVGTATSSNENSTEDGPSRAFAESVGDSETSEYNDEGIEDKHRRKRRRNEWCGGALSPSSNSFSESDRVVDPIEDDPDETVADATWSTESVGASSDDIVRENFQMMKISDLREFARQQSVDISDCLERRDIVERLARSQSTLSLNNEVCGSLMHKLSASSWDIPELRALASLIDEDVSHCANRQIMVDAIRSIAAHRPQSVALAINALCPYIQMTKSQLCVLAQDRGMSSVVASSLDVTELYKYLALCGNS